MPRLVHVYDAETYGECEAFYDADTGELIHIWSCNDASWRGEYLEPIFEHYGFEFVYDKGDVYLKLFQKYLKETYKDEIEIDSDEEYEDED